MAGSFSLFIAILAITLCAINAAPPNTSRVVGGDDAYVGQFPHQVSLQYEGGSHTCGGSIISERFIVTAAHCVVVGGGIEAYPPKFWQVRVGSIQRSMGGQLLKIKRVIVNKEYGNFLNDVALLELEQPLTWTDNIKPIELATEEVPSGEDVIISGWGRLYRNGPIPNRLQWNTLKAISSEECDTASGWGNESLICLAHELNNGACNGDSGGPAVYKNKLVGIAGFVVGGCGSRYPDGYAKISYHRDWILKQISE